MKCDNCKKREATLNYYESINGEKREVALCEQCAKSLQIGIDFNDLLSPFLTFYPKELFASDYHQQVCRSCQYTLDNYLNTGFFGCPDCYDAFSSKIDSLLTKVYGNNRHQLLQKEKKVDITTKKEVEDITDIEVLRKMLKETIETEQYENAAQIRDRIKKLDK